MKLTLKNPFIIATITIVLFLAILRLPLNLILDNFNLTAQQFDNIETFLKNIFIITLSIIAIKKLNIIKLSGLSRKEKFKNKFLLLIPFYTVVFGSLSLVGTDLSNITIVDSVLLCLAMLSVGFVEEFIFRGILQSIMLKRFINHKNGVYISVLLPALLFGLLHLVNLDPSNIAASVGQVVYAFFIGSAFGAILLRTNKLIPLAILHGLIDIVFSVNVLLDDTAIPGELEQQSFSDALGSMLFLLPLFVFALFTIRKISKESIVAKMT
ncbi:MAG: CPBP family intramembrane metalloprotease [Flavobacteriaceae bacterium]